MKGDAQRLKVSWGDIVKRHQRAAIIRVLLLALGEYRQQNSGASDDRRQRSSSRGFHTRHHTRLGHGVEVKLLTARLIVTLLSRVQSDEADVLGIESQIKILRRLHTADEQPRAD